MTDTERGLLQAVMDAPDDDAPRLIYADWLDERGRASDADRLREWREGVQPGVCTKNVYEEGTMVFMTHTARSWHVELWVRLVACASRQRVDWYYLGGRAAVKALGDLKSVADAMLFLMPALRHWYNLECGEMLVPDMGVREGDVPGRFMVQCEEVTGADSG